MINTNNQAKKGGNVNFILQWKAFHKIAAENKFKANLISVYNALLYFANESFWAKEFEITFKDALAMAGVDKDIYSKCLKTLFDKGFLDKWEKGSNRHTKARISLRILYKVGTDKSEADNILPSDLSEQVGTDKSEADNILPSDLSEQVGTDKSEADNILPSDLSEQVGTDKSEHLIKQVNNIFNNKTDNKHKGGGAPDVDDNVLSISNIRIEKKEKGCAEKEKAEPGEFCQSESPFDVCLNDFVAMRKKIRKPPTPYAMTLIKDKLEDLAPGNEALKILILQQSIVNAWQDVFPLRQQKSSQPGRGAGSAGLSERDRRMEELRNMANQSVAFLTGGYGNL